MPIEKWSDHICIAHLATEPQLSDELQALQEQAGDSASDIVLDLAAVHYINSSHLAKLLKLRKLMVGGDCRLVLCAIDPQVWGTFLVTGLDKIFEFAEAVPTALATLQLAKNG